MTSNTFIHCFEAFLAALDVVRSCLRCGVHALVNRKPAASALVTVIGRAAGISVDSSKVINAIARHPTQFAALFGTSVARAI